METEIRAPREEMEAAAVKVELAPLAVKEREASPVSEAIEAEDSSSRSPQDQQAQQHDGSEYDSAEESYSEHEHGAGEDGRSESEDGSVVLEREEGDGQESTVGKKVDDDEDKKNPQYIPKRGTFYEHDDRTADDDGENTEEKDKLEKESKKKIWTDKKERWSHDKFNDNDQAPKSKTELIAIYGYDIRNEDGPPRARRRRRYGRGPNKYTRNWEDEDAYSKPPAPVNKKVIKKVPSGGSKGTTPPRPNDSQVERQNQRNSEDRNANTSTVQQQYQHQHQQHYNQAPRGSDEGNESYRQHSGDRQKPQRQQQNPPDRTTNNKNQQRAGMGRVTKPQRDIKDSDYSGFTKPRQFATKPPRENMQQQQQQQQQGNRRNQQQQGLEKDMAKMTLQEHQKGGRQMGNAAAGSSNVNNRQNSVPPRLQGEVKGSKRYSSIRQRSLPESQTPPFNQQHNYYANADYNQQSQLPQGQQNPQQILQAPPPQQQMPPQTMAIPPPPIATMGQQVPVTAPLPPQFGPAFPQAPPPFLQAAPPPFIPQQPAPPLINYVQGQPQYAPPQPPYQGYQQTFNPVTQPTEIFQPPGGITYYSAQDQQAAQRAALQKRPKAAIPIVPPPPLEPRGRGRALHQEVTAPGADPSAPDMSPQQAPVSVSESQLLVEPTYEDAAAQAEVAVQQ